MNKILTALILSVLVAGCVAHVTPEGTYLEPLPLAVVLGPPVIMDPPHHIALRPLPPIMLEPQRPLYFYNNLYYYTWDNAWYYGERERGPWHRLPREYYPKQYRDRDRDRGRDRGERQRDEDIRHRDRY